MVLSPVTQAQNLAVPWSSFALGGGISVAGNSVSVSSAGESFPGFSQSADYRIGGGFLAGIAHQSGVTSVEDEMSIPLTFELYQNYPNPFNPSTTIAYDLPFTSRVTVRIFNLLGQVVATLVDEQQPAGQYKHVWHSSSSISSGVYFYRIHAKAETGQRSEFVQVRKLLLLR